MHKRKIDRRGEGAGWRALSSALLFGLTCAPVAAASTSSAPMDTLYSDATVIDGTGSPPTPHQDILVSGERIVAIGAHGSLAKGGNARRVDVAKRFIIPGLIDSHVHIETPPDNALAKAMLRRDLYGGVTAVRDMADDLRPVGELKREAYVGEIPAPDIFYAVLLAGPSFFEDPRALETSRGGTPGAVPWMQAIDNHTDIPQAITLARGTSATAIKIYADLSPVQVSALTREAHHQHMLVWAHGAVFPARPADVIGAGVDVVSHACYLAYQKFPKMPAAYEDHTPVPDALVAAQGDDPVLAKLFDEMKERGEILDATGRVFVAYEQAFKPARCTGATATRITAQAWRAGLAISTGTDYTAAPSQDWPEVHDELLFLAHDVGMPPLQVLRAATLVGAEAAGQAADMGSLAAGKLANFVILQADPSVDIRNIRSIQMTVKRGRQYLRSDYVPTTRTEMKTDDGLVSIPAGEWAVPGQPASVH